MSVIYEVNLSVTLAIADEYQIWLMSHLQAMLALPGFRGAQIWQVVDETSTADTRTFCCQYELNDQAALDSYFQHHAAEMRADGIARFGDLFQASRRILHPLVGA